MRIIITSIIYILLLHNSAAQQYIISTNLLTGIATLTPNVGIETQVTKSTSVKLSGSYNAWNVNGSVNNNRKLAHWLISPEFRVFLDKNSNVLTCQHFIGMHLLGGEYNVSNQNISFIFGDKNSQEYRYQGYLVGIGVIYGYKALIAPRWNIEFNIGLGSAYLKYDQFCATKNGELIAQNATHPYYGITQLSMAIGFVIFN